MNFLLLVCTDWHDALLQVGHGCLSGTDLAGEIPRESLAAPQKIMAGGAK